MNLLILSLISFFIFLFLFFILRNKDTKEVKKEYIFQKREIEALDIYSARIPQKIKEIEIQTLLEIASERFKAFVSLDYKHKKINELKENEWNNWEFSIFIYLLQKKRNILIPEPEKIFHGSILRMHKSQIENELKRMIQKYNQICVNETTTLKKQIIWTRREVSILFYYFVLIKEI